jgi:hypothetical protein
MAKLLVSDAFDSFCMQEAVIMTSVSYNINGRLHTYFYPEEERSRYTDEFIPWSEIRPKLFEMIKGKNLPISFRITLSLATGKMHALMQKESPEGVSSALRALVINIRFENGSVVIMTGTSYDSFVIDRTEEKIWDSAFARFLTAKDIAYTIT